MIIDIGIINYNSGESLSRCVSSLSLQSLPVRIFIFDNASMDSSLELLEKKDFDCTVIRSSKNLGYAGACNELLLCMDSEIQVLCNMDLEFNPSWAEKLRDCFNRYPKAGSVASLVMERSGVVNAVGVLFGKDLYAENEGSGKHLDQVDAREKEVFGCYGAVMSFRKECVQKVGLLDASFFLFFEESEWYFRINLAGYKTIFCPEAKVFHERSLTTVRYSPLKLYYSERNRLRSAFRLLPFIEILKLPFYGCRRYYKMARGNVPKVSGDGKKLSKASILTALAKAWISAILALPSDWKVRRKYQQQFGNVSNKVKKIISIYPIQD